jgi:N-acetylmuramoyl-L-alanine amidase
MPTGVAHAAEPVRMVVRDVLPQPSRTLASATPRFNLVGVHWQGTGMPWFRTRSVAGGWSRWQPADDDEGGERGWRKSAGTWTGDAEAIQWRLQGHVTRVREYLLWSPPLPGPERRLQLAGSPAIIARAGWHADESIVRKKPKIAPELKLAVVHHTATTNAYSCARSASIVRGIEVFHVKGNGWDDIGYNFLVDACGQVFEGRWGGIERNVVGAHSGGFNSGTVGVSMIGNFERATPSQAQQDGLVNLLAWRLDVGHVDPRSTVAFVSKGNGKFRAGRMVNLRAISAHRDTYLTACPGSAAYRLLPAITNRVAQTGLPKLYAPTVTGAVGGPVTFAARLSTPLPWTITVSDPLGITADTVSGFGVNIDWIWNATFAAPGAYTWVISAGGTVRPALSVLGGKTAVLTLTDARVSPQAIDGSIFPTTTVSYTLSTPASITAERVDSAGVATTLFTQNKSAGTQSFLVTPAGLADGNYTIRLTARNTLGRQAQATVPFAVSHTVFEYSADARLVSPNGDGRFDSAIFRFLLSQTSFVTLTLESPLFTFPLLSTDLAPGQQSIAFTGAGAGGSAVPDGDYSAKLTVGTLMQTLPLVIDRAPPALTLVSLNPLQLKVLERVSVFATVNGREIRGSKAPGVFTLAKGETVRTLSVVVRDAAGNDSAPLTYPRK